MHCFSGGWACIGACKTLLFMAGAPGGGGRCGRWAVRAAGGGGGGGGEGGTGACKTLLFMAGRCWMGGEGGGGGER